MHIYLYIWHFLVCCHVLIPPFPPTAKFTFLVPKPRLGVPKPRLGVAKPRLGDPQA